MNSVNIIGRVTKDIALTKNQNNKSKVNFTVAVDRDKQHTDYIFCTAYGKLAEIISKYVKKGNEIGVTGSLYTWSVEKNSRWEYGYSVNCDRIEFLESKQKAQNTQAVEGSEDYSPIDISDDDLPY